MSTNVGGKIVHLFKNYWTWVEKGSTKVTDFFTNEENHPNVVAVAQKVDNFVTKYCYAFFAIGMASSLYLSPLLFSTGVLTGILTPYVKELGFSALENKEDHILSTKRHMGFAGIALLTIAINVTSFAVGRLVMSFTAGQLFGNTEIGQYPANKFVAGLEFLQKYFVDLTQGVQED